MNRKFFLIGLLTASLGTQASDTGSGLHFLAGVAGTLVAQEVYKHKEKFNRKNAQRAVEWTKHHAEKVREKTQARLTSLSSAAAHQTRGFCTRSSQGVKEGVNLINQKRKAFLQWWKQQHAVVVPSPATVDDDVVEGGLQSPASSRRASTSFASNGDNSVVGQPVVVAHGGDSGDNARGDGSPSSAVVAAVVVDGANTAATDNNAQPSVVVTGAGDSEALATVVDSTVVVAVPAASDGAATAATGSTTTIDDSAAAATATTTTTTIDDSAAAATAATGPTLTPAPAKSSFVDGCKKSAAAFVNHSAVQTVLAAVATAAAVNVVVKGWRVFTPALVALLHAQAVKARA